MLKKKSLYHAEKRLNENQSLKAVKGTTVSEENEILTLIWKHLWTYLWDIITYLFTKSIELGYHSDQWKQAQIVMLKKSDKSDYSVSEVYHLISLLNILRKILKTVIARRLLFWTKTYKLLSDTEFEDRSERNTEQTLLVLTNAIDRIWLQSKVVTLIAFDLKEAFNEINKVSLNVCLQTQNISTMIRWWIYSFMKNWYVNVIFNNFQIEISSLENAGLMQESSLSFILFEFFNSDLVD